MYILPTSEECSESGFSAVFAHLFTAQLKRSPTLLTANDLKACGAILILGQNSEGSKVKVRKWVGMSFPFPVLLGGAADAAGLCS